MEELLEKFNKLKKEKWIEAAEVEMVLQDQYPNAQFVSVRYDMQYTEQERKELEKRGEEDRKVAFWVGRLKYCGYGGYEKDLEEAYMWVSRAETAGHVSAIYWKGHLLKIGEGVKQNQEAALKCYEKAGAAGHGLACFFAGEAHRHAKRFFQAAFWFQRGAEFGNFYCKNKFEYHKREQSMEICPWGEWRPDKEYHSLVPPKVQEAVKTTLLLFKRLGITRYIAWQVCFYVMTRSGWE